MELTLSTAYNHLSNLLVVLNILLFTIVYNSKMSFIPCPISLVGLHCSNSSNNLKYSSSNKAKFTAAPPCIEEASE